jgi:hypothetical protein
MTILFNPNSTRKLQVMRDLQTICPDPGLGFSASGQVTFVRSMSRTPGSDLIEELSGIPCRVFVRAEAAEFSIAARPNNRLSDVRGTAIPDKYPGTTSVEVAYDGTNCNGKGAWTKAPGGRAIPEFSHVLLFHELTHALHFCRGDAPVISPDAGVGERADATDKEEEQTRIAENLYRKSMLLPTRATTGVFANVGGCNPPPPGSEGDESSESSKNVDWSKAKCFVASAAYGSPLEPEVELLRRFRDDVLRKTRTGAEFFEDFYRHYDQVGSVVVERMQADPRITEVVRWALVMPIVHQLDLALRFPDADLDEVEEPWRSFLEETRDFLERWAGAVEVPESFDGLSPSAAAAEIELVLRYFFRTGASRGAYLDRLSAGGQLPLRAEDPEAGRIASRLRASGRSERDIGRIVGTPRTEVL